MVHSSAMEIRPDGCDNQPFGKFHTHSIWASQGTYVYLDVFICWIIFIASKWLGFQWCSYLESKHENFFYGKNRDHADPFCQTWPILEREEKSLCVSAPLVFSTVFNSDTMLACKLVYCLSSFWRADFIRTGHFFCLMLLLLACSEHSVCDNEQTITELVKQHLILPHAEDSGVFNDKHIIVVMMIPNIYIMSIVDQALF